MRAPVPSARENPLPARGERWDAAWSGGRVQAILLRVLGSIRCLLPGLYFCGIQFQYAASSMLIQGAGRDGAYVADRIGERHLAQSRTLPKHVRAA